MDRRWFGALVVACTVLVAVVAPNVTARRVGGSAIPAAIDGPPSVGMCVLTMTDPWRSSPQPGFALGTVIDYPTAVFDACAGTAVAEVVRVDAAAAPPQRVVDNNYQTIVQQCALSAIGYLGSIPPVVYRGGQPGILWSSVLAFRYTAIGPTAVQRAAGQRWSACAVGSTDMTPYVGRLRDVLSTGVLPPAFGSCWPSVGSSDPVEIRCDSPHAVELLGWTSLGSMPVSAIDLRQACTIYAGRALRTPDPSRNGAIRPEILAYGQAVVTIPSDDAVLQDDSFACALIAQNGRLLDNTLIGIGERPLPLV